MWTRGTGAGTIFDTDKNVPLKKEKNLSRIYVKGNFNESFLSRIKAAIKKVPNLNQSFDSAVTF